MSARIFKPSPSATQSGKASTKLWVLNYEPEEAMEIEPLMGWSGSGDMRRQITLRFATKEEAIAYCERNAIALPRHRAQARHPQGVLLRRQLPLVASRAVDALDRTSGPCRSAPAGLGPR